MTAIDPGGQQRDAERQLAGALHDQAIAMLQAERDLREGRRIDYGALGRTLGTTLVELVALTGRLEAWDVAQHGPQATTRPALQAVGDGG